MTKSRQPENGYSLVELLVATVLFTIIAGTIFSLLFSAQLRYSSESGLTTAFQQANVAIDQITRDIHSAGYPAKFVWPRSGTDQPATHGPALFLVAGISQHALHGERELRRGSRRVRSDSRDRY